MAIVTPEGQEVTGRVTHLAAMATSCVWRAEAETPAGKPVLAGSGTLGSVTHGWCEPTAMLLLFGSVF